MLASHPQDTLKDLAEQGLERIHGRQENPAKAVAPPPTPASPPTSTLIQDPFLTQPTTAGFTGGLDSPQNQSQTSATPWLDAPATTGLDDLDEEVADQDEGDALAEADLEPSPEIEIQASSESEDVIEADIIAEPEPEPEPGLRVNPSILQRLERGRLQVTLPAQQKPPPELSSGGGKGSTQWSWLRRRLGRG
mgnify:FL=1